MKCTMLNNLATLGKTTLTVHNTAHIVHEGENSEHKKPVTWLF